MSLIHVQFTVDERDAIDGARTRLRGYITLLDTLNADDRDLYDESVQSEAVGVLIDDMRAAIHAIDTTFAAADDRRDLKAATERLTAAGIQVPTASHHPKARGTKGGAR